MKGGGFLLFFIIFDIMAADACNFGVANLFFTIMNEWAFVKSIPVLFYGLCERS